MTDRTRNTIRRSLLLLLAAVGAGYGLLAWSFPSSSHAQAIVSAKLNDKIFYDPQFLNVFYQERDLRPVWLRGSGTFQPRAKGVLKILENSWTHGLNPEKYHITKLNELAVNPTNLNRYEFDLLLSDAVIRYTRDLTGMRGNHNPNDRAGKYWREPMTPEAILQQVALSSDPVNALHRLAPNSKLYQALRSELVHLASEPGYGADPVKIGSILKPGQSHKAVAVLRERFLPQSVKSLKYDDALAAEIMKFQRRNGIEANGVIRADTVAALNHSKEQRMLQIIANMERLRWMEQGRPDKYVLVNIPSASLWAVQDGEVALEMPVIVGKTARPTYSFKTEISGVRFNPNWTVPPTIKNADFLPLLQENPLVLTERGIRITYKGQIVDPAKVDWKTVTPRDLAQVKMIQNPGDDNPLGKVRVIMENPYNIYLHDTNHREMFDKDERMLSSGCIRVSQPEKLADFILNKNEGWSWNGMQKMIDSGRMRDVKAEHPIPVYITYQTIWLDSEGTLIYGQDVYGQDAKLGDILRKAGGIHIPQIPVNSEISL
jgi:murein L,D-transpeptidase YcbB/YkuD